MKLYLFKLLKYLCERLRCPEGDLFWRGRASRPSAALLSNECTFGHLYSAHTVIKWTLALSQTLVHLPGKCSGMNFSFLVISEFSQVLSRNFSNLGFSRHTHHCFCSKCSPISITFILLLTHHICELDKLHSWYVREPVKYYNDFPLRGRGAGYPPIALRKIPQKNRHF